MKQVSQKSPASLSRRCVPCKRRRKTQDEAVAPRGARGSEAAGSAGLERGAPRELVWDITHPRLPAPPPHAHSRGRGPAPCFLPLLTLRPLVFRGLEARPGRRPIRESGLCPFLRPRQLPREPGPGGRRPRGCAERPRGPASGKGPSTASGPPGRTGPRLRVWAPRGTLGHPGRPGGSPSSPPWALVCAAGALPPPRLVPHGDLRFHSRGSPWARPGLC